MTVAGLVPPVAQTAMVVDANITGTTAKPAICTSGRSDGATITLLGPGTCTVRANQPGDARYKAAPAINRSFTVTKVL